jgi:hypothetical protein
MIPFALKCDLIARQERLELARAVIAANNSTVKYVDKATFCPVCLLYQTESIMRVNSTVGEIRYCGCELCGCTVAAIGEVKKPKIVEPVEQKKVEPEKKKLVKKKKPKPKNKK